MIIVMVGLCVTSFIWHNEIPHDMTMSMYTMNDDAMTYEIWLS